MASKYYVGDTGTDIYVDLNSDISSGTEFKLKIIKPSGTKVTWTGALDGTTKIKYTTSANDWDEAGDYKCNAYVALPAWSGHGNTTTFHIYALGE